ncbi:hypothetical protein LZC95_08080 [Pendulispora brunnea]|uniref:Uncharacterized protein n=1 Tax=Pendulispora brunnea TaxID=2905690 RepID=A0ABZ2KDL8_9BACT
MSDESTFDANPPFRPGLASFHGAVKVDHTEFPPNPLTMPSAGEYNLLCKLVIAYGKVLPVAIVDVKVSNGTASVDRFTAAGSNITLATFTIVRNGAGDIDVLWPATAFPPAVVDADASVTEDVEIDRIRVVTKVSPPPGMRGVTVRTRLGTIGVDARFQLRIY